MQSQVKVTPARWWHVPGLSRLLRETRRKRAIGSGAETVPGAALVWRTRWSPSLALLQSIWAAPMPGMPGPRSFVAEQDGRPVGLAQMTPRREPHQWEVVYLVMEAPVKDGMGSGTMPALRVVLDRRATRLLGELCDAAMLLGAERLLARIGEEGEPYQVLRQVGFTPVVREFTYFRPPAAGDRTAVGSAATAEAAEAQVPGLRPQQRSDAFGLLQLYQDCTPKVVQMAEGKRSHSWELAGSAFGRKLTRQQRLRRWVVERDGRKMAWLQIHVQRRGPHQMRMMVDEHATDVAGRLVEFALGRLREYPAPGVVVRVREHQTRLLAALEAKGFAVIDTDLLMVKQLALPVMQRQFAAVLEKVV